MLEAKYSCKPIGRMTAMELVQAVSAVIIKIHVITGWTVPQKEFVDILVDQLTKKFVESYPLVNTEEIEYAFRNNTSVKDWGKAMNLALIDEVMVPYLDHRFEISRIEEQQNKPAQIEYKVPEMTDEELLKATFETWKVINKPDFIPESLYYYLETKGILRLNNDQKRGIMARVSPTGDVKAMCRKVAVADYFKTLLTT